MEKMLVGALVSIMAAFIAVFMVVVLLATFFAVLATTVAVVWLLVAICRAYCKPLTANEPDPAPLYLRKWTTMRRWDARREQAQWQELFDNSVR
jgi:hypothetical protein